MTFTAKQFHRAYRSYKKSPAAAAARHIKSFRQWCKTQTGGTDWLRNKGK